MKHLKKTNKLLAALLAVILALGSLFTLPVTAAEPTTWWHDNAAAGFAGGTGTENDPYLISTPAQFAYFGKWVDAGNMNYDKIYTTAGGWKKTYFKITADLNMSAHQWRPVGYQFDGSNTEHNTALNNFRANSLNWAVIDGGGHTISGVKLTASPTLSHTYNNGCALFTKATYTKFSDLNLEVKITNPVLGNCTPYSSDTSTNHINTSTTVVAGLVGCLYGNSTSEINNCHVNIDLDVNGTGGEYMYAGLVGYTQNGGATIKNCSVSGDMSINLRSITETRIPIYVAGILGRYFATEISNCTNNATITVGASKGGTYCGGIMAFGQTGPKGGNLINNGDITFTAAIIGVSYVGGVFGMAPVLRNQSGSVMSACTNTGDITLESGASAFSVGGIAGNVGHHETNMIGYRNSGNISITKTSMTNGFSVGGLVGELAGTADQASPCMSDCHNTGNVSVTYTKALTLPDSVFAIPYAGGIVGRSTRGKLTSCTNSGDISIANVQYTIGLGGITGLHQENEGAEIDGCENSGNITVNDDTASSNPTAIRYVGGIVGRLQSDSVLNSVNRGSITLTDALAQYYLGGIVGYGDHATTTATSNINYGDMSVTHLDNQRHRSIGGILGGIEATATISGCTNNGDLSHIDVYGNAYIGGILPYSAGTLTIDNCVNNGSVSMATVASGYATGANHYVGGISGILNGGTATIRNCKNNGAVTGTGYANMWLVGGIVGRATGAHTFTSNENHGNVRSDGSTHQYVGGLIGELLIGSTTQALTNAVNTGSVTGTVGTGNTAFAGIVGRLGNNVANGVLTMENCFSGGEVLNHGFLCGGLIGYSAGATNTYTLKLKKCFSVHSGCSYGLIGSNRANALTVSDCFYDTEWVLTYHHNDASRNITINDVSQIAGDNTPLRTVSGATKFELATLEKARVRLDTEGTSDSGIRFDSYVDAAAYDTLKALSGVTVELGTMIAPTENLKIAHIEASYDKMAALDAITSEGMTRYLNVPFSGTFNDRSGYDYLDRDDHYYFSGAINEMKESSYNVPFTAIAYVRITLGNFSFIIYADYDSANEDRSRSISQVAKMAFEDRLTEETAVYEFKAGSAHQCYLGDYSPYSNVQLAKLKEFCSYVNQGTRDEGFTINGVSIERYVIVYAQSPIYKKYGSTTGKTLYEDLHNLTLDVYSNETTKIGTISYGDVLLGETYDYDYQSACRIRDAIQTRYGVTLEVVADADTNGTVRPESDYEILVGRTNRAKSQSTEVCALSVDEYLFRIDGTKVVVCGGAYGTTWHATDEFIDLMNDRTVATDDYDLKWAGSLDGSYKLNKIACVGDSITRGSQALPAGTSYGGPGGADTLFGSAYNVYVEQFLSYPANLQRLMWQEAVVYNFGRGSSTAGKYPSGTNTWPVYDANYYAVCYQFENCLTVSNDDKIDFDLVFMMHGTNDSNYRGGSSTSNVGAKNWNTADKLFYQNAVEDLILKIHEGSPNAIFVLNNVPHRFDGNTGTIPGSSVSYSASHVCSEANTYNMTLIQRQAAANLYDKLYTKAAEGEKIRIYHYNMNQLTRTALKVGNCSGCGTYNSNALKGDFSSVSEGTAHGYYYNWHTTYIGSEGTHPNFRGYQKIAQGLEGIVDYVLNTEYTEANNSNRPGNLYTPDLLNNYITS